MGHHMNGTGSMNGVIFVILIISMISLFTDYNNNGHLKIIHFYVPLYRINLYYVPIITCCIIVFL